MVFLLCGYACVICNCLAVRNSSHTGHSSMVSLLCGHACVFCKCWSKWKSFHIVCTGMEQSGNAGVFCMNSGCWNYSHTGHSNTMFLQCGPAGVACMHLAGWKYCDIVHSDRVSLWRECVRVFWDYRCDEKSSHTSDTEDWSCPCLCVSTEKKKTEEKVQSKGLDKTLEISSY